MRKLEKTLAIRAAKELQHRERRTAKALLVAEARAVEALRKPIGQATDAVVAAHARGGSALEQVRRQVVPLQSQLQEEIRRSHSAARSAGRARLEAETGRLLSAAPAFVDDEAFAEIVAGSLAQAWGSTGLSLLSGNQVTITARELAQLAELVDARVRKVAATEVARTFNREREVLIDEHIGAAPSFGGARGRDDDLPRPGAFKVWSALLDRKTCPRCFALDGEIVELHKSFSVDAPPVHPHCRCIVEFIVVHKPERLEDIAIDYDLFKQELRDVIREGRAESQRHAVGFASDSLGAKRSPATLTTRFRDERYATAAGGAPPPPPPPAPPRRPPPPGGGGGSSGGGSGRRPLDFQFGFTPEDVQKLGPGITVKGDVERVTQQLFGQRCPTADSWRRLWEPPPGYSISFKKFEVAEGRELQVAAVLRNPAGKKIGDIKRTFYRSSEGELQVSHDWFEIPDKADRKNRVGTHVNRAAFLGYREMGVREVTITAALENGPVVWAKQGFSWGPAFGSHYEQRARDFVLAKTNDAALARDAGRMARLGAYHVVEFAPGGRRLGEEFLMSIGSWSGSLRLDDADPGYQYATKKLGL